MEVGRTKGTHVLDRIEQVRVNSAIGESSLSSTVTSIPGNDDWVRFGVPTDTYESGLYNSVSSTGIV